MSSIQLSTLPLKSHEDLNALQENKSYEQKQKACKDFEIMFAKFVFNHMIPEDDGFLFSNNHSSEIYKSLWVDAMANVATSNGEGLGISKYVMNSLNEENSNNLTNALLGENQNEFA